MKTPALVHIYAAALSVGVGIAMYFAVGPSHFSRSFGEITVERINVVEADGTLKLVIANSDRQADVVIDGQFVAPGSGRPPGLIFMDDNGDEMGGLVFNGDAESKSAGLFFDRHGNDQVLGLNHTEWMQDGRAAWRNGLELWDRNDDYFGTGERIRAARALEDPDARRAAFQALGAEGAFGRRRMFVGRTDDGAVVLRLSDADGRVRLRIAVAETGDPKIEFLDEEGQVLQAIAP